MNNSYFYLNDPHLAAISEYADMIHHFLARGEISLAKDYALQIRVVASAKDKGHPLPTLPRFHARSEEPQG